MKKLHNLAYGALSIIAALTSCQNEELIGTKTENDRINAYTTAWLHTIGLIPADQDWCMLDAVTANVSADGLGEGAITKIYTSDPAEGGRLKATITGNGSLPLDVSKGTIKLYAKMYNTDGAVVNQGLCDIENCVVTITPASLVSKRQSRHVDDFMVPAVFDAIIICEDMGSIGDFDFNDIVLGLKTVKDESKTTLTITPLAAGGLYEANIWFGDEDKGEIHSLMRLANVAPSGSFYNTTTFNGASNEIVIDNLAADWTITDKWADDIKLKIKATDLAYEISAPHADEAPQMMCLPGDFYWPRETKSIKQAYTGFQSWATGGYQGDDLNYSWLDNKSDGLVVPWEIKVQGERLNYFIATCADGVTQFTYNGNTYTSGEKVYIDNILNSLLSANTTADFKNKIVALDVNGSHFDTSNVAFMGSMFLGCEALTSLDLSNFDTSNVTNMQGMFCNCKALTSLDLSSFDTSNVTDMQGMFSTCETLTSLDLSNFDTSKVTDMHSMFPSCKALTSLNLSSFDTSNVTTMSGMFADCQALTSLDLSSFDTSNVTTMSDMFAACLALTSLDLSNFDTSNVTTMSGMFSACLALPSLDLSNFDTSKVTNMNWMFASCQVLPSLDLSNFDTSEVTNMQSMFSGCQALTSLDLSSFDTSKVTNMQYMFSGCFALSSFDLSSFDTSKVTNMQSMFSGCFALSSLDLSSFDTSNVTTMSDMFSGCQALTSLDLSRFDTSKVTNMQNMFFGCQALTSLDLSKFDPSRISSKSYIFKDCNPNLEITCTATFRNWCIANKNIINLPVALQDEGSSHWHIVP